MRTLLTKDVFSMARIISKMDIKEDMKRIAESVSAGKNQNEVGVDLLFTIIGGASTKETEKEIYNFIGDLIDKTAKEVSELPPDELIANLTEVTDVATWKSFFEKAVRLIIPN